MGFTTEDDVRRFLIDYTRDMGLGEEDPAAILDRYFVPDFEFATEDLVLDRQRLIEHVRPVRRNVARTDDAAIEVVVHEALVCGDQIAARYELRTMMRKGKVFHAELYMFGRLAPDGRIRRIDQVSKPDAG